MRFLHIAVSNIIVYSFKLFFCRVKCELKCWGEICGLFSFGSKIQFNRLTAYTFLISVLFNKVTITFIFSTKDRDNEVEENNNRKYFSKSVYSIIVLLLPCLQKRKALSIAESISVSIAVFCNIEQKWKPCLHGESFREYF